MRRLVHAECKYALWNVIIAQRYAYPLASTSGIVSGRDVFAILPTGFGKSLCYACLPTVFDLVLPVEGPSIVLVVSHSMPWVIRMHGTSL